LFCEAFKGHCWQEWGHFGDKTVTLWSQAFEWPLIVHKLIGNSGVQQGL